MNYEKQMRPGTAQFKLRPSISSGRSKSPEASALERGCQQEQRADTDTHGCSYLAEFRGAGSARKPVGSVRETYHEVGPGPAPSTEKVSTRAGDNHRNRNSP